MTAAATRSWPLAPPGRIPDRPRRGWRDRAACADVPTELFYPVGMDHIDARAVAACVGCPVRGDCLAAALNGHEPHGVWGGLTPDARRRLARTRSNRRLIAAETRTRTVA